MFASLLITVFLHAIVTPTVTVFLLEIFYVNIIASFTVSESVTNTVTNIVSGTVCHYHFHCCVIVTSSLWLLPLWLSVTFAGSLSISFTVILPLSVWLSWSLTLTLTISWPLSLPLFCQCHNQYYGHCHSQFVIVSLPSVFLTDTAIVCMIIVSIICHSPSHYQLSVTVYHWKWVWVLVEGRGYKVEGRM